MTRQEVAHDGFLAHLLPVGSSPACPVLFFIYGGSADENV